MTSGANNLTWAFDVSPKESGMIAAGASAQVTHSKVSQSGVGTGDLSPCGYCGGTWILNLTWSTGGGLVSESLSPVPVTCVF